MVKCPLCDYTNSVQSRVSSHVVKRHNVRDIYSKAFDCRVLVGLDLDYDNSAIRLGVESHSRSNLYWVVVRLLEACN